MNNDFFIIGKSKVNFCEPDFCTQGIGEMWNVLSSFGMVFFGLYGIYKINLESLSDNNKNYLNKKKISILYLLLVLVGFGSVYFHWELSPFAHWVDIIFISMILLYSQYLLSFNSNNIFLHKVKYLGLFLGHLVTSIYIPQIHIFLLFGSGFVVKNLIEYKIDNKIFLTQSTTNSNDLVKNYESIKKYFTLALVLWAIDYFGCKFITPYHTHWIFHILIGYVSYKTIELNKYFNHTNEN